MKILVTGSTGMVGCNLLKKLCLIPHSTILAPDRKKLNLFDQTAVSHYIQTEKPDTIIHLAAKVGGIQSNINEPATFFSENLRLGMNVVLAALDNGVKRLLNIGSASIYQENLLPHQQTNTKKPDNEAYALAKFSIMQLCQYISLQHNVQYKTLIPCNLYGPHDDFNLFSGHLIPAVIHKLFLAKTQDKPEVTIWGDGKARREFMYVEDFVNFILLAISRLDDMPMNINIGTGRDHSINEYYQTASEIIGFQGKFIHDLSKPAGGKRDVLDITAAKRLGWQASTSLNEGITKTYNYFLSTQKTGENKFQVD